MDTSDSKITFDADGRCAYCANYYSKILPNWHTDARGEADIMAQVEKIKADGKGKDHDCLVGRRNAAEGARVDFIGGHERSGV